MTQIRAPFFAVVAAAAAVLFASRPAAAFNPQPEPPGDRWRVEGYIDMTAREIDPADTLTPFGVEPTIINDDEVDFHAGIIATFTAVDNTGDGSPDDGLYTPTMEYFYVQIGDTNWDATMPYRDLQFGVEAGLVASVQVVVTYTTPHPDLAIFPPASPGTWLATDARGSVNLGTISGVYTLRDGVVPEPGTILLLAIGVCFLAWLRRPRC